MLLSFFVKSAHSQSISLVKDTMIQRVSTDSMYFMDREKIIPFKDSGVLIIAYGDSVVTGQSRKWRLVVTAMDKDLNTLWSIKFPFNGYYTEITACTDNAYNAYITYYSGGGKLLFSKISPQGQLIFSTTLNSSNFALQPVVTQMSIYRNYVVLYGCDYISQTSFTPVISLFKMDGSFYQKKMLTTNSNVPAGAYRIISYLTITNEDNLAITYVKDNSDNNITACYDSLLKEVWTKTFTRVLGYTSGFGKQGNQLVFINMGDGDGLVSTYRYDAKTGNGGLEMDNQYYDLKSAFIMKAIPLQNGNYLSFGNYNTTGGFDCNINYFDIDMVLASIMPNSINSRNRVSDACIVGNSIYAVVLRFVDKYCDQPNYIWRGTMWVKKYNTDFLNFSGVSKIKKENDRSIYPNPFDNQITIKCKSSELIAKLEIFDALGHIITAPNERKGDHIIVDTRNLSIGLYIIRVTDSEEVVSSYRLMKLR